VFDRKELISIREKAGELAAVNGTNETWVRAYQTLADAADRLDAMLARCELK
jgi:hypothetical protein